MHFMSSLLSHYLLLYKKGCLLLLRYTTMDSIWRKMLAIFYICTLLRICENKNYREWLYPFMNVGKYVLTNYISQSILTLVILSLYFKDVSHIYYWQLCTFGILIILAQIIFNSIWSKYFRYGPIEWIWRKGIYKNSLFFSIYMQLTGKTIKCYIKC